LKVVQNQAIRLISGFFRTASLILFMSPKRLEFTQEGWTTITENDLPLLVPAMWQYDATTLTAIAHVFTCILENIEWDILPREIYALSGSPCTLLVYATTEQPRKAETTTTSAVAYYCGRSEVRRGERLIGTEQAGNLMLARAMESATILAQLIPIDWQADGKVETERLFWTTVSSLQTAQAP